MPGDSTGIEQHFQTKYLQNLSGTFKSYRKSVMEYDHWVKMEGKQENHHVLNDLPLKRAL